MKKNNKFAELGLSKELCEGLKKRNHTEPTPIQRAAIPNLLLGRDFLGLAQTGTGKTGAFILPILNLLANLPNYVKKNKPRALVLVPTRELAIQIGDEITAYKSRLKIRHAVIFGGVNQSNQVSALCRGIDIIVATPGRLLDLRAQGHVRLSEVQFFVLDEADRMLDMGFIIDINKIIKALPKKRQSLLFSATMPKQISALAIDLLCNPVKEEIKPQFQAISKVDQSLYYTSNLKKRGLLLKILLKLKLKKVIIFAKMKHRTNRLAEYLCKNGIKADSINGNKSQSARQRALKRFRIGEVVVLVATDIASRGIDIDNVTHVINYDMPNDPESYIHRIGRTARAGASGTVISLCVESEIGMFRSIQKLVDAPIRIVEKAQNGISRHNEYKKKKKPATIQNSTERKSKCSRR